MSTDVYRCPQMSTNVYKCLQMSTDAYKCLQLSTDVCRCLQMSTDVHKCLQMSADARGTLIVEVPLYLTKYMEDVVPVLQTIRMQIAYHQSAEPGGQKRLSTSPMLTIKHETDYFPYVCTYVRASVHT